ncbi:hypothetical protein [Streptomyces sp. NBC_00096]|uniref:hypothetical protein n=1 Tax=Streptomyces sp. NBC_00096 TaxID=2975650 RepID=UPI00324AFEE7
MYRPLALLVAFYLCVAGIWAVATTPWSGDAVPAPSAAAALVAGRAPTGPGAAPSTAPSSAAPTVPAVWTLSTLRNYLVAETAVKDPGVALADLEQITLKSPYVAGFCHPVTHEVGHAALAKYHGDFTKAVSFPNDVCGSGYLHGVVEEKLQEAPNPSTAVTTLCSPAQTGACIHGIGHGAMFVSHLDVPAAEKMCDRFPQAKQVTSCSEGIFMQLFEPDEGDPTALAKLPADKLAAEAQYPCAGQPAAHQSACYFYAPIYYLQTHDYAANPEAFVQGLAWCLKAPTSGSRSDCSRGMGSRTMKYNIDRPVWVAEQCQRAPSVWQRQACAAGMVSYWDVNYADKTAARTSLCPKLSGEAAANCRLAAPGSGSAD